jgi:hypothetical protein
LGPREGKPVKAACPLSDSLRSVAGWFIVALLLLLRKGNRTRQAWLLFAPLFAVYLSAAVVERQLNAYLVFYVHQYLCSALCDVLCFFSVGIAIVLCLADDAWKASSRLLRFLAVLLSLCLIGGLQVAINAWPTINGAPMLYLGQSVAIYGIMAIIFMVGHRLLTAVLRRCVQGVRFWRWHAALCLALGVVPLLVLFAIDARMSAAIQLQSTRDTFRIVTLLASGFSLPWFAMFWFAVLGAGKPYWRRRLAPSFDVADQ